LHFLDVGAYGIQVPQVNDKQAVNEIVAYSKYGLLEKGIGFSKSE